MAKSISPTTSDTAAAALASCEGAGEVKSAADSASVDIDVGVDDQAQTTRLLEHLTSLRRWLIAAVLIMLVGAVYLAKTILLPVALAFMLTLTLSPIVRYLGRLRIPEPVSALLIVVCVGLVAAVAAYNLAGPIKGWIDGAPANWRIVDEKFRALRAPVNAAISASKQVEKISRPEDPSVQRVAIEPRGILAAAAFNVAAVLSTTGVTMVLLFFMLASGRLFYEKLVRISPTMTEKKRAIRIVHAVEEEVSRYLLTIMVINSMLGVGIGLAMWALGMPNPALWGVMATALNFVPYIGALTGVAVVTVVALVTFEPLDTAIAVGGAYLGLTAIEGQLVTPGIVGKRLEMNTVAVFLAIVFWGWLWGVPGALMAVPFLVSLRVLCAYFDSLSALGEFLGGPAAPETQE